MHVLYMYMYMYMCISRGNCTTACTYFCIPREEVQTFSILSPPNPCKSSFICPIYLHYGLPVYTFSTVLVVVVYFYNYGWMDYGVPTLESVLDMVKVVDFAVKEGKVAIHCHAGLGRTGVLIACYLIYSKRMGGDEAITAVREKRLVTSLYIVVLYRFVATLLLHSVNVNGLAMKIMLQCTLYMIYMYTVLKIK